jgi:uncharacterized protein YbjT (DUF2867 family)
MFVVIGATGNTGSAVADALLAAGQKVRVLGRTAARLERFTKRGADAVVVDISEPDASELAKAFSGATAVYAMIPPELASSDVLAYSGVVAKVIVSALQSAAVDRVVMLSSYGADKPAKTGPVVGLHRMEELIIDVGPENALFLRPGYFMENLLPQISVIKNFGLVAGPVRADVPVPFIATRDIGAYAASKMMNPDYEGRQTREILGPRDYTYSDVARIIGEAIGNPGLSYMQMPPEQIKPAMVQMGMTENLAGLLLEMADAMNTGHMAPLEKRTPERSLPTSLEQFVKDTFVPLFEGRAASA